MHHRPDHREPACASCKHQRKKCEEDCPMAPFFPFERKDEFAAVHKIFGVSNVAKQLRRHGNQEHRNRIAKSLIWVAKCFEEDPIDGPLGLFQKLEKELHLYRSREYFANTTSQDMRMSYNPPTARFATTPTPPPPPPAPPGAPMNGWNHNNVNGGTNPYRNGAINLIDNSNGASPFSSLGDHQNGSLRVDHNLSSHLCHNFGVSNNGVAPELYHPPNISGWVVNNVVHQRQQPSTHNDQLIQKMENQMLPRRDPKNGVLLPAHHHHHPKQISFNQQSYNSSRTDANNSQNLG